MRTNCPHCRTVFRVDPRKVPNSGARARCSVCREVFHVSALADTDRQPRPAVPPPQAAEPVRPAPGPINAAPAVPTAPVPAEAAIATSPRTAEAAGPAVRAPGQSSPFGVADPQAKARRLARALVSDIVTYHPERRDTSLAQGTLKQEFREEIRKSWEEYIGQVGTETAHGTPHFRDALNEILARGQKVF